MASALRRTEAKAFFANERTFLHWMNMAVTTGSISAALLGKYGRVGLSCHEAGMSMLTIC